MPKLARHQKRLCHTLSNLTADPTTPGREKLLAVRNLRMRTLPRPTRCPEAPCQCCDIRSGSAVGSWCSFGPPPCRRSHAGACTIGSRRNMPSFGDDGAISRHSSSKNSRRKPGAGKGSPLAVVTLFTLRRNKTICTLRENCTNPRACKVYSYAACTVFARAGVPRERGPEAYGTSVWYGLFTRCTVEKKWLERYSLRGMEPHRS